MEDWVEELQRNDRQEKLHQQAWNREQIFQKAKDKWQHENTEVGAAIQLLRSKYCPEPWPVFSSPVKITTHKLTHRKHGAQTLWTHPMQDTGVPSPSLRIQVDATEHLKQSQGLLAKLQGARISRYRCVLIPAISVASVGSKRTRWGLGT